MNHLNKATNRPTDSLFKKCDQCIGITPHTLSKSGKIICAYCKSEISYTADTPCTSEHFYAA